MVLTIDLNILNLCKDSNLIWNIIEIRSEFVDAIEVTEVYHKSQVSRFLITYTLNLGFSFRKVQTFSIISQEVTPFLWTTGI